MPRTYRADSLEKLHKKIVSDLLNDPEHTPNPAGRGKVNEVLGATIVLTDPRNRLITSAARKANYAFGVGELCWYLRGDSDLGTMAYYNRRMEAFSDDGKTLRSAYGARIFNSRFGELSQFDLAQAELLHDPDSRRAVVHINEDNDLFVACTSGTKDVPCTLALQFFVREKKLHLHVTMRSNDVIWGMAYDVFSFTFIQEAMLEKLRLGGMELELGEYYHTAGSLHLYERHLEMAKQISKERQVVPVAMDPIGEEGFKTLLGWEEDIRTGIYDDAQTIIFPTASIGWMCEQLMKHRKKRLSEVAKQEDVR